MAKSAKRRHHIERIKNNRKDYWGRRLEGKELSKIVNTPNPCNCWMCRNPRKTFGNKDRLAREVREDTIIADEEFIAEEKIQKDLQSDNEIEQLSNEI